MQEQAGKNTKGRSLVRRLKDRIPSRREVLQSTALIAVTGFVTSLHRPVHQQAHPADLSPFMPRLKDYYARLHGKARQWILQAPESIARPGATPAESYVYTVDLAQLMEHFALAVDLEPYLKLRQFAIDHVIIDDPKESFTKGFVLWRCVPNTPPDASGTTEALRVARALWTGGKAFNRAEDKALALTILDGYARHGNVDQDIWLIRNYFGFGSKSFATNTFVIDYDADFVRQVASDLKGVDEAQHKKMSELADNCFGLMRRTPTPCGLLYDLVQPELKTMYWGLDVAAFSPNDVIQTNNACTTAATIAKGEPAIAKKVLAFVTGKQQADGKVYAHYYGRTGERVSWRGLGAAENMSIAKLGALLGDKSAVAQFVSFGMAYWEDFTNTATPDRAWATSEILLGLKEVIALDAA